MSCMWEPADPELRAMIDHVVVVMMENRSFDHMLGYLSLENGKLAAGESVDGLPPGGFVEEWNGVSYRSQPMGGSAWPADAGDPPHGGQAVAWQVADPARYLSTYVEKHTDPHRSEHTPTPDVVMRYMTADDVPMYDFLASNYCVCDQWFCSVPGATWPNRLFAIAGYAGGETDIPQTGLEGAFGNIRNVFDVLDERKISWRWYSSDPSLLRALSPNHRWNDDLNRFAYVHQYSERQPNCFLSDARDGRLPAFSWVDPNFFRLPGRIDDGLDPNDDHPPQDVMKGQRFVNTVYSALTSNKDAWERTLLLITYDEHGGLYDHCKPPGGLGPRVPAFVVSPLVKPGRPCHAQLEHTAIIQTTLRLFADEQAAESLGPRVFFAEDVLSMLDTTVRPVPQVGDMGRAALDADDLEPSRLPEGASTLARAIEVADKLKGTLDDLRSELIDFFIFLRGGGTDDDRDQRRKIAERST